MEPKARYSKSSERGEGPISTLRLYIDRMNDKLHPWQWFFPLSAIYVPFLLLPILAVFVISFFGGTSLRNLHFVGLSNYAILLDGTFYHVLGNTVAYMVGNTTLTVGGGLLIAIAIQNAYSWIRNTLQLAFLLPFAIMPVGVGLIWSLMYHPSIGVINSVFELLSLDWSPLWLGSSKLALPSVIVAGVWWSIGFYSIIWMVGLNSVDETLYEAAKIDGAGPIARFIYVTLPQLKPIGLVLLIISFITSLRVFGLVWIMTRGGPGMSTEVMVTWLYRMAFIENHFGQAAAIGVILFVLTMIIAAGTLRGFGIEQEV